MSFLNELINSENDEILREELHDRIDIVTHKIKFMDKVPVVCLDTFNMQSLVLVDEINAAGGILETEILGAVYIIYYQPGKTLNDLMREVPALLDPSWPAVKNGRIILLNDDVNKLRTPTNAVMLIEDFAEMLHPGFFIFGYEGDKWIRFNT
ncbi:ABC transporter substrate-binding protein [Pedobacter boryungensis]|uniref:ABC transporter substrate-binding protein n=1 Tax=Pedobacter boryungensis TaxID=869962 RepID=A0ABX2DGN5_9SPHI|nr:ABC transporter substrate-binding protein [Pedobacter boryungensis]NQX33105.1 ABC transporter substrate-binding protein [Pedobacter boryungensis]